MIYWYDPSNLELTDASIGLYMLFARKQEKNDSIEILICIPWEYLTAKTEKQTKATNILKQKAESKNWLRNNIA